LYLKTADVSALPSNGFFRTENCSNLSTIQLHRTSPKTLRSVDARSFI